MHTVPPALAAHWRASPFPPAALWTITRKDGTVLRFTDAPRDLTVNHLRYESCAAEPAAAGASPGLRAALNHHALTEEDLQAGRYDGAEIVMSYAARDKPSLGSVTVFRGYAGEIRRSDGVFTAECLSLKEKWSRVFTAETYSPLCRARFGDARCGKNPAPYVHVCTVISATTERRRFTVTPAPSSELLYRCGTVLFTSGALAGMTLPVSRTDGAEIHLSAEARADFLPGDTLHLQAGCDKRFTTCKDVYANAVNFRGEPHLPGAAAFGG